MIVDSLLVIPGGDIPLGPYERTLPFKTAPGENHPFLSLGDYFRIIERSLSEDHFSALARAISSRLHRSVPPREISRLVIRSEKHGALYHVAGVDAHVEGGHVLRFALNTALSKMARTQAAREFCALETLSHTFGYPYLPDVYFFRELTLRVGDNRVQIAQFLSNWLEDFYEWHLIEGGAGDRQACIWDTVHGYRFIDERETGDLFRQAARILTLYYDLKTTRRIHPVRHSAGDFVVRANPRRGLDVRLTTARDYAPLFEGATEMAPELALFFFFLDLTLRMRLDREEGIGDPIWAGAFSVQSTVLGFLEALPAKERGGRLDADRVLAFRALLRSFSGGEFKKAYEPLLESYRLMDPGAEFTLIERHLRAHSEELYRVIQALQ